MSAEPQLNNSGAIDSIYDSSVDAIYLEAWKKTIGMKTVFWKAFVSIGIVIAIISLLTPTFIGIVDTHSDLFTKTLSWLIHLAVNIFLVMPLIAGLFMLCIKNCSQEKAPINMLFQYIPYWKRLWIFPVVIALFGLVIKLFSGAMLYQLAVIFIAGLWTIVYLFYIPLSLEKNYSVRAGLETARKTILQNSSRVFSFVLLATIILFISALTFGIALIWTLPWLCNAIAVFYRDLFGVQVSLINDLPY